MRNKYGFDIDNPMSWYLYEKSQPNLRKQDPYEIAHAHAALQQNQIAENVNNAGEWLMGLPFSLTPVEHPVNVLAPNYHVGKNVVNREPRPLIDTKATYRSKNLVNPIFIDPAIGGVAQSIPTLVWNKQGEKYVSHIPTDELIDPWHYNNLTPTTINKAWTKGPASWLPTEAMVDFNKPQLQYTNPGNLFTNLHSIPGLPVDFSPLAGTKAAEAVPALQSIFYGTKNKVRSPLEPIIEPASKAVLDALVTGAKVIGPARHLIPKPLKDQLPPHIRAMLHYFVGGGAPTDLGIKYDDLLAMSHTLRDRQSRPLTVTTMRLGGSQQTDDYENAFNKYYEHVPTRKVPDYDASEAIAAGASGPFFKAINKYFIDKTTGDAYDDYRFYDLAGAEGPNSTEYHHAAILGALLGVGPKLLGRRSPSQLSNEFQNDSEFRAWLASRGTPYPVVIKNPNPGEFREPGYGGDRPRPQYDFAQFMNRFRRPEE
jgi:hypothetical protein